MALSTVTGWLISVDNSRVIAWQQDLNDVGPDLFKIANLNSKVYWMSTRLSYFMIGAVDVNGTHVF